jgi:heme/copper-type cytochrome/quinol oxidase subunit 2
MNNKLLVIIIIIILVLFGIFFLIKIQSGNESDLETEKFANNTKIMIMIITNNLLFIFLT